MTASSNDLRRITRAPGTKRAARSHLVPSRTTTHAGIDEQNSNDQEEGSWPGYPR